MLKFYVEVFSISLLLNYQMDLFLFGIMIDTGQKFLSAPSALMTVTLKSRSQT